MKKTAYIKLITLTILATLATTLLLFFGCKPEEVQPEPYPECFTVTYFADEGGRISGNESQEVAFGGNGVSVYAEAEEGYKFVQWSDGVTTAERREQNVISDISVTAIFDKLRFTVEYLTDGNGNISGKKKQQQIEYGNDASTVSAEPNEGYRFVKWSDGYSSPIRTDTDITSDFSVTALFEKQVFKVKYLINRDTHNGGFFKFKSLDLKTNYDEDYEWVEQYVEYGNDAEMVTANPYESSRLVVLWSDGYQNGDRQELCVKSDITVTAFLKVKLTFSVNENIGGKINGELTQFLNVGDDSKQVIAVPNNGYAFTGWSDLANKKIYNLTEVDRSVDLIAYFEPIEKKFKYDYGIADGISSERNITLNRNNLHNIKFAEPEFTGYTFCGWYADKDYKLKVVNESGIYMLGYLAFTIDSDTLYAKWIAKNEVIDTHKILIVVVDEIDATLYSSVAKENINIKYKMTTLEREICSVFADKVSEFLNQWFEDEVTFEVDLYYTLNSVGTDCFLSGRSVAMKEYHIYSSSLPELGKLNNLYHSVLTAHSFNDYARQLHNSAGLASLKYGSIFIEDIFSPYISVMPLETLIDSIRNCSLDFDVNYARGLVGTFLHEFTHTVETYYTHKGIYEYHKALALINDGIGLAATELYLLGKFEVDGKFVGIPSEYWKHEVEIPVNYVSNTFDGWTAGKIIEVGTDESQYNYVYCDVSYGSSITVEAIPNDGYEFLYWSDGITTSIRNDKDIISYLTVIAIFGKRNC